MSRRVWFAVGAALVVAVAVVAFLSYRSAPTSGTPAQQLSRWVTATTLGQHLGALHDDALDLKKVLDHRSGTTAVHTVCSVLEDTAQMANAELPSPTSQLTQLLAKAYDLEYEAGGYCYTAGATDEKLLAKSATARSQAERVIAQAMQRVSVVTGHTVSTTTTTAPTTGTGIFG